MSVLLALLSASSKDQRIEDLVFEVSGGFGVSSGGGMGMFGEGCFSEEAGQERRIKMKSFACGDVVPGCDARWVCNSDDEVLSLVAAHAASVHGLHELPDSVITKVRSSIVPVV